MFNFFKSAPKNYEDIRSGTFHELMLQPDTIILDVRTAGEFAGGKIRGAKNIDIMSRNFSEQVKNLSKNKTYLIYCRSGNRSGQACEVMAGMGFESLKNMTGGISRWPFEMV